MRRSDEPLPRPARMDVKRQREDDPTSSALGADNAFPERRGGPRGGNGTERRLIRDVNGERRTVQLVPDGKGRIRDHPAAVLERVRTTEGCRQVQHGAGLGDHAVPVPVGITRPERLHATVDAQVEVVAAGWPGRRDLIARKRPRILECVVAWWREAAAAGEGTPR